MSLKEKLNKVFKEEEQMQMMKDTAIAGKNTSSALKLDGAAGQDKFLVLQQIRSVAFTEIGQPEKYRAVDTENARFAVIYGNGKGYLISPPEMGGLERMKKVEKVEVEAPRTVEASSHLPASEEDDQRLVNNTLAKVLVFENQKYDAKNKEERGKIADRQYLLFASSVNIFHVAGRLTDAKIELLIKNMMIVSKTSPWGERFCEVSLRQIVSNIRSRLRKEPVDKKRVLPSVDGKIAKNNLVMGG